MHRRARVLECSPCCIRTGSPAVMGSWNPLDRWLCVPHLSVGLPLVGGYYAQARSRRSKEQVAELAMGRTSCQENARAPARRALVPCRCSCCSALRARFSSSGRRFPTPQRCAKCKSQLPLQGIVARRQADRADRRATPYPARLDGDSPVADRCVPRRGGRSLLRASGRRLAGTGARGDQQRRRPVACARAAARSRCSSHAIRS